MNRLISLFVCITYVCADVGPGRNQYLPPDKGYNYDRPALGVPTLQQPNQVPYPQQPRPIPSVAPSYIPPVSQPTRQPTYQQPTQGYPSNNHEDHHHHEPGMPFDFNYSVNDVETANDYSHKAVSDGDVTRGEYRVQLPDGRTQIVRYTADWKNGYNAEVSYEGEASYPEGPYGGQQPSNGGYKY